MIIVYYKLQDLKGVIKVWRLIILLLLLNGYVIIKLTIINKRLEEKLHEARIESIKEINKLRKED